MTMRTLDGKLALAAAGAVFGAMLLAATPAAAQDNAPTAQQTAPAPLNYPEAAPASVDMYHWSDFTQTNMHPGSVSDMQWKQDKQAMDAIRMREQRSADWYNRWIDPMPVSYPFAAPGDVAVMHWRDYTGTDVKPITEDTMGGDSLIAQHNQVMFHRQLTPYEQQFNDWVADPAPMTYPIAAPGDVAMFHWSDYTAMELQPGSPTDVKRDRMHDQMRNQAAP